MRMAQDYVLQREILPRHLAGMESPTVGSSYYEINPSGRAPFRNRSRPRQWLI
jgi:hypothetical protein